MRNIHRIVLANEKLEGALGRTMQIQFKDKAVSNMTLLTELFIKAREDARHMRIWHDINNEVR